MLHLSFRPSTSLNTRPFPSFKCLNANAIQTALFQKYYIEDDGDETMKINETINNMRSLFIGRKRKEGKGRKNTKLYQ
jgi:hypothetical protein